MNGLNRQAPIVVWFRDDLRLADQPALHEAALRGAPLVCLYIHDEQSTGLRPLGGASRWWLHHALTMLSRDLAAIGGRLDILTGSALDLIPQVASALNASCVLWTRRYEAGQTALDRQVKAALSDIGIEATSFNGQLLHEPWTVATKTGGFFKVFSPFWRAATAQPAPPLPLPAPKKLAAAGWDTSAPDRVTIDSLRLLPTKADWAQGLRDTWTPGEISARTRLASFIEDGLDGYALGRDRPDLPGTSALSPHLRFGEITPRQIWHAVQHAADRRPALRRDADKYLAEIGWREFAYHLLFHAPDLLRQNFQDRFDDFPWRTGTPEELAAWRQGKTGYPIVDAGMRQLWTTGYMHNRVRMICASFLVKDLMIDWRVGEDWFWDTLCDADPASNPASWQWVAGSGADAAPYFRIFNPVLQAMKFDPDGTYVRIHVPELAGLPSDWIHRPWEAPPAILKTAGVSLPNDYPFPVVDHGVARKRALTALSSLASTSG